MPDKMPGGPNGGTDPLESLDGPGRAAILLMALGEEDAAQVLRHMEPEEVQSLGMAMTSLKSVSQREIRGVLDRFMENLGEQSSLSIGTDEFLRKTLVNAMGREKANNIMAQVLVDSEPKGLDTLNWMDPRAIANIIRDEHPQIIAIVLAHVSHAKAGQVLDLLPHDVQTDVMVRVAGLDSVHPAAIEELDQVMQKRFEEEPEVIVSGLGGIKVAAEILNSVSSATETRVFDALTEYNDDMSEKIQENMFVFENLLALDDRGMQLLLREIPQEKIVRALKGTSLEIQQKVFRNVSQNAAELMRDDLDAMGPIRLREVEEVQKDIMAMAQRLAEEGQIALGSKDDEFV
jgi:flagellar motor switch protein FliG